MKRMTAILSILALCVLFGSTALAQETYDLKLQTYYSANNISHLTGFAQEVEELSQGRIKIHVFSGGELVSTPNILKSIRSGMIDMGVTTGYQFTEVKMGDIEAGLPMAWLTPQEAEWIFDEGGLLELIAAEYAQHGVKYLNILWNAQFTILSKTPINSLNDLRGMKIRAMGGNAKMMQELGVSPVAMPPEDIYLGLSTGMIDACLYGAPFEYEMNKWFEVAPYILMTPVLDPVNDGIYISQKVWDSMPEDLQTILQEATQRLRWSYYNYGKSKDVGVLETIFKGKVTTLSEEDVAEMTRAAVAVWETEIAKGANNARAVEIIKESARRSGRIQ